MHRELNQDFFKTWTSEMAYILGYFAADGSMLKNGRGGHFIEFTTTDRCLLVLLKRVCRASQHISIRPKRDTKWKEQYRLQIGSKEWFADLLRLGFTQAKSNTLRFPEVPAEYLGHFVRGYFDGDGCVYFKLLKFADRKRRRWILMTLFTSGSRSFLESLQTAISMHGIKGGSLVKKISGFDLKFSHKDSVALYQLMYHTAEASNLFLPRKREKLERAIKVLKSIMRA